MFGILYKERDSQGRKWGVRLVLGDPKVPASVAFRVQTCCILDDHTLHCLCVTEAGVEKTGVSQYSRSNGTRGYSWMWERNNQELPSYFHVIAFEIVWDICHFYLIF